MRLIRDLLLRFNPSFNGVRRHPPGHFYSPLLDLRRLATHRDEFIDAGARLWGGIDLRRTAQLALLDELLNRGLPFALPDEPTPDSRYYANNDYFRFADGFSLAALLPHFRPRQIVEVGSGFSTALMLDVTVRLSHAAKLTCIEPFPDRLRALLTSDDLRRVEIIESRLQDVSPALFEQLEENDLLFIDSSHVAKVGSDVTELFLRILPALRPGVIVHLHDIFYPHAYPERWLSEGCAWNEGLFLRTFLQYNRAFEIVLFNAYLGVEAQETFAKRLPRFLEDTGGSIYLRRTA